MDQAQTLLTRLFDAYNLDDWAAFSTLVTPDIDWPNQTGDGRLIGHDALKSNWQENRRSIRVEWVPVAFTTLPDGRVQVDINQSVYNAATGQLWSDTLVRHAYALRDGLVAQVDVAPLTARS